MQIPIHPFELGLLPSVTRRDNPGDLQRIETGDLALRQVGVSDISYPAVAF